MPISVTIPARQPEIKKQEVPAFEFTFKNQSQIKEGDTVVFSFWNKKDESTACYGGIGKISEILSLNNRRFYVKVQDYRFFEHRVSVMLPNGKYVEQLGDSTAADIQFPGKGYQIRTISQESLDYIINTGGIQHLPQKPSTEDIEFFESELRDAIRSYYVDKEKAAIYLVERLSASIGRAMSVTESHSYSSDCNFYNASVPTAEKIAALKSYLQYMKMSYSYKPILVMALMQSGKPGVVSIEKATRFFRKYYADRREQGLTPEKRRCIYLREDVTDKQIAANLVSNPVKALCESGFFFFNEKEQIFSLSPEIWPFLDKGNKATITKICKQRLKEYYSE